MENGFKFIKNSNKKYIGKYVVDGINYIYLFLILCVFPLVFHDYYFDITRTRRDFFVFTTIGYIVLMIVAYVFEESWSYYHKIKSVLSNNIKNDIWLSPELWMAFFLASNFLAYLISLTDDGLIDGKSAFSGENGRLMGLSIYLVMAALFFIMGRYVDIKLPIYTAFGVITLFSYFAAICQHIDPDLSRFDNPDYKPSGFNKLIEWFWHYLYSLKNGISKKQYNIFISTFGNINIFACFIVISLACFVCMFIFANKLFYRIFSGIIVAVGGIVMMIANSDSAYIGVGCVMIFMLILSYKDGILIRFFKALILLGIGNLGIVLINRYMADVLRKKYDKRGGFAEHLDRIDLAVLIIVFLVIVYIIAYLVDKKWGNNLKRVNKNKVIIIALSVLVVLGVLVVIIGHKKHIGAFTFNYRWGTFRGYIWTKCAILFRDAPIMNKLFGYGNESVKALMTQNYYDEMITVTKKVYDNAHNELLQYLVTTGLCGMLSYIGLFISCFVYILKNSKQEVIAYISLSVMLGYFVQGLINLNQPITTPFYFVFMAVGVGYVRGINRKNK